MTVSRVPLILLGHPALGLRKMYPRLEAGEPVSDEIIDAFGSTEKTLQANMGGHTGVPQFAGEDAAAFFARHLRRGPGVAVRSLPLSRSDEQRAATRVDAAHR